MSVLAAVSPDHVVLAGDAITWGITKSQNIVVLIQAVALAMAIFAVLAAWWKTRSFVGTLTALVLAGLMLWGLYGGLDFVKGRVESEITEAAPVSVTQVAGEAADPAGEVRRVS